MLNTDKVRGILRAKQGSLIPKYQEPFGPLSMLNPLTKGSFMPFTGLLGNKGFTVLDYYDYQESLRNKFPDFRTVTNELSDELSDDSNNEEVTETGTKLTGNKFVKAAGNFLKNNGNQLANMGLDILGNSFNNVENSGGVNTAFAIGDTIASGIGMINPAFGLAAKGIMTAVKGINSIGGSKTRDFSINLSTANLVGSSYGGSMLDIMNANDKAGKKYGLFSGGSRRRANRLIRDAEQLLNIMTEIANDARDIQAMSGNDLNYTNYKFNLSGGYDLRYMRAAKSGMKLQDKIDFIKSKKVVNTVINLDTKEIEWEPIITEVEEFKEGGNLPELQEPIIEDTWEPIITDYIEEYKEGGKTKELEAPEIEETSLKNLIPEGALHKNKHHMEHSEGLTKKGIPVIDNDGEQLAEIELDEIIFTLEVTKKLEELYKEGTDKAAIEAGKLLVKEILFNTDDRTGLISKCAEGGKINELS